MRRPLSIAPPPNTVSVSTPPSKPPTHPHTHTPTLPYLFLLFGLAIAWTLPAYAQQTGTIHGDFSIDIDCAACHRTEAWTPLRAELAFDHSRQTRFPLTGAHAQVDCASCHLDARFDVPKIEANDCASCHLDVHQGAFPDRCVDCHTTTTFREVEGRAVHNQTRFPLTGAHAQISCESCHSSDVGGAFSTLDTDCLACHEPDYDAAHGEAGFPTTCQSCHNTLAWGATPPFDHAAQAGGFALLGAHETLACADCHQEPSFQPIFAPASQDDCLTCHQDDYEQQHGGTGLSTACADCHSIDTWEDAVFDHAAVAGGFGLIGSHATLDCAACHNPPPDFSTRFSPSDQDDCLTCHQVDFESAHAGSGFPTTCQTCHNNDDWTDATFEHAAASNGFGLVGAHEPLPCSACHAAPPGFEPLFAPTDQDDCLTCHQADYDAQHAGSGFPTTCLTCHGVDSWDASAFDHAVASSGFGLVGAHEGLDCSACHGPPPELAPLFTPTDQDDCFACHQADYQDEHADDGFPTTCQTCHTVEDWDGASFDHAAAAGGFGLIGSHEALNCSACHGPSPGFEPLFSPVSQDDCLTCHQVDFESAHAGSGFPTTCQTCHNNDDWTDATFEHAAASNGFGLVGAHEPLPCSACHAAPPGFEPLFAPTDQDDCLTCHQADYDQQHAGSGFPTTCLTCHGVDSWDASAFDHAVASSGFGLVGAHEGLDCSACHGPPPELAPLFTPTDQDDCFACHQPDYDQQHTGSGFPTQCLACHNTDDWSDATFNHASVSQGFDLVGAHEVLDCSACHGPPPDFTPIYTTNDEDDCLTCHQVDFEGAHAGSGFPTTCLTCHNNDDWTDATFEHAAVANGFGLVGAHEPLPCAACHAPPPGFEPLFNPADQDDCIACHQPDYDQEHGGSGFPTTCLTCHTIDRWDFSHTEAADGFPLVGAHDALDCSACHAPDMTPLFNPQDENDCFTCHQDDYQQEHAADGYPYNCLLCHNNNDWNDADFNHTSASGGYVLVGAHEPLPCSACHGPPPDLTPLFNPANQDDCFTCHQDDYQQEHAGSGFPTTCLLCHNNNDWGDADFDHDNDFFPIFSGKHRDEWQTCMDCHIDPGDFNIFSCLTCHEHNQQDTDEDHDRVPGYVYESSACYACHPNGEKD